MRLKTAGIMLVACLGAPSSWGLHEPDPKPTPEEDERLHYYDEVEVKERSDDLVGVARSATEGSTGARDLARRPILRTGELVETMPGAIATQHSGGGKGNQYFVRGFNLDHGTDLSFSVDGVPVNLPSHGHGQGYADLNFVIPELIETVRFRKGTHFASEGDFSAAGSLDMDLVPSLPRGIARVTAGGHGHARALLADSFDLSAGTLTGGLDIHHHDGPWEREDHYKRLNGLLRFVRGNAGNRFGLTAMAHRGSWLSTDQVPRRAIESGAIGRFGIIDRGPRGDTDRYSLSAAVSRGGSRSLNRLAAFVYRYELDLFSNFTYLLDDPAQGDQFKQTDARWVAGLETSRTWMQSPGGFSTQNQVGLQARLDSISNGLFRTRELERLSTTRRDDIRQWTLGGYAESAIHWRPWLRTTLGLRADAFAARVESNLAKNSGSRTDLLVSPKLSGVLGPWQQTEVYFNFGFGHHSNDARGATIRIDPTSGAPVEPVPPLVRARGADIGVRTSAWGGIRSSLSLFYLDLDSELVFVGDGGFTEASRPSRRRGVEWANHYHLRGWLFVDLDLALSQARFTDRDPGGDRIPGALESVVAAALTVDRDRWFGALRLRYFSGYPLIEDDSVRAGTTALLNGRLGFRLTESLSVSAEGFNLLDREDSDIEYFYLSRLEGEPLHGVEDVHLHPIESPAARFTLTWEF